MPLGSVVLIHCALDRIERRKTFITCKVTSTDESKLYTEATGRVQTHKPMHFMYVR